jgi:AGZA family xanthine/uracil permease-like MFS transporter
MLSLTQLSQKLKTYFKFEERNTTFLTELRAGIVTFLTMAYILAVNAAILENTGGTCDRDDSKCLQDFKFDITYATAISAGVSTLIMGVFGNLPFGLAPGMGLNAFFTFDVVLGKGVSYKNALFATFIEGVIFLIISLTGIRHIIVKYIPGHIKLSMGVGIGLFLAHIGLQSAEGIGLITGSGATLVTLGGCDLDKQVCYDPINGEFNNGPTNFGGYCECPQDTSMEGPTTWLGIGGFVLLSLMIAYRVKGAIFISIMLVSIISWFRSTAVTYFPDTVIGNERFEAFKDVIDTHTFKHTPGVLFEDVSLGSWNIWYALITFLYVDFFDTSGSLFAMADLAGLLKEDGTFPGQTIAFCTDAIGTMLGAVLGTSTVTTYIESGAGIEEGGRTGVTAIVISFLFFLGLLFAPVFASIPPWAVGPSLIIIGSFMVKSIKKIDWEDPKIAIPSFITMVLMPLTYSIAYGVIGGLGLHFIMFGVDYIVQKVKSLFNINNEEQQEEPENPVIDVEMR